MKTLKIEELSKNFGSTEVLKKINLEIDEGNFLVLLGPSGCGKSTLLNIIAGLETINEGDVFIDDYNVSKVEPKDRNIAMVFQSYALYPSMNVKENMIFGLKQAKTSKEKIQEQLEKVSKFLQVDQLLERKPSQLSGGQRQRVAIGRALVREPRIFLFDEPLSNLDAKLRVEMRREIKKLHQQLKTTVVYVTHDQTEAMSLGTNIAIMNHGVIQQNDTPENIYNKPSNTFVADFIGSPSMNLIKGNLKENSGDLLFTVSGSNLEIPIKDYDFKDKSNLRNFWFISKNKEEPRYADRFEEGGAELEQPLAIARDIKKLNDQLISCKDDLTIDRFLMNNADLRHVVRRAFIVEKFPYAEIQDNTINENVVPIDMLRLKLSFFGALKFDPKSDKWLRICMFQGAPLPHELKDYNQHWVYR